MADNACPTHVRRHAKHKRIDKPLKIKEKKDVERKEAAGTLSAKNVRKPT